MKKAVNDVRVGERAKIQFKKLSMSFVGLVEGIHKSDIYIRPQGCKALVVVSKKEAIFTVVP